MITVTYKDLNTMQACRSGKNRFAKRFGKFGWLKAIFMNRPVSLHDILNDGYNTESDFCWLIGKLQTRLYRDDYKMIAAGIKELLIKHNKWDVPTDDYSEDPDIHRLNKVTRVVLEEQDAQGFHRHVLLYVPLNYHMGYYGPGNNDLHQDMRDFLINLDTTVDWKNDLYCKW